MMAAVSPAYLCLRLFSRERTSNILIMNQPHVHCAIVVGSHWPVNSLSSKSTCIEAALVGFFCVTMVLFYIGPTSDQYPEVFINPVDSHG